MYKVALLRKKLTPLTEKDFTPYLVRGLNNPLQVASINGNNMRSVDAVLYEVQRLEVYGVTSPVKEFKTDLAQDP